MHSWEGALYLWLPNWERWGQSRQIRLDLDSVNKYQMPTRVGNSEDLGCPFSFCELERKSSIRVLLVYLSWLSSVNSLTSFVLRRVAEGGHSSTLLRDGIGRRRRRTGRERVKVMLQLSKVSNCFSSRLDSTPEICLSLVGLSLQVLAGRIGTVLLCMVSQS